MATGARPVRSPWSRGAAIGFVVGGVVGGILGLVLGLDAHPATAWAAVFELGIPAAIVGTVVGFLYGALVALARRLRPRHLHDAASRP
jgi:MFS family permease